jgi:hypothetical protein
MTVGMAAEADLVGPLRHDDPRRLDVVVVEIVDERRSHWPVFHNGNGTRYLT